MSGERERIRQLKRAAKDRRPFLGEWIVVFYEEDNPDETPVMEADNPRDFANENEIGEAAARSALTRLMPGAKKHLATVWVLGKRCVAYFVSMRDGTVLCSKEKEGDGHD